MATIQENLNTLSEIKTDIKTAIINKGVDAGDDITVYGDKIREISGGEVDDTDYLCFEAIEDSGISFSCLSTVVIPNIEYSFDKQTWTPWDYNNIDVLAGQKVYFRGDNINGTGDGNNNSFVTSSDFNISGCIYTLQAKNGRIDTAHLFTALFRTTNINRASLHFPDNVELTAACFLNLFLRSTIKFADFSLPYLNLPSACYEQMFYSAQQLKEGPYIMCKNPIMATNIGAMYGMFLQCSNLQYVKADFITIPYVSGNASSPTYGWLNGASTTGCFIKAKDATWTTKANYSCPTGWTLITSVS